mgnify:CR=1 FL=1
MISKIFYLLSLILFFVAIFIEVWHVGRRRNE